MSAGRAERRRSRGPAIGIAVLALACLIAAGTAGLSSGSARAGKTATASRAGKSAKGKRGRRPNIVVVMTDDQRADELRFMPQLEHRVVAQGVDFRNFVVSYSLCCPSRSTYFTGQYAHNHGVLTNEPPYGSYSRLAPTIGNTLPVWLQRAGYFTGHIGKLLNHYNGSQEPPGWNRFYGSIEAGAYGYSYNENGRIVHYGTTPNVIDPPTYQTDVQTRLAEQFIRQASRKRKPFFLNVATFAPHLEDASACGCANDDPRAAPRDEGRFANLPFPTPPNYNEADVSDKPALIANAPRITTAGEAALARIYRDRLESLLAVDDLVGGVVKTLKRKHVLRNTVILFTSDNGWMQGEHRVTDGKVLPYEESIKVPLVVRGPGFARGVVRNQLVGNVDLTPTLLALAHGRPGRPQDGVSMLPLLRPSPPPWQQSILLESWWNAFGEEGNDPRIVYKGVRTDRFVYVRYEDGEEELYDLQRDPYELQNEATDPAYASIKAQLVALTLRLQSCAGVTCRVP